MSGELPDLERMQEQVTQAKIDRYAELSGDFNPLHVDPAAAAASEFGGTIAHGPISLQAGFRSICSWLGEPALGAGTTISVTYRYPVRPGDTVGFEVTAYEAHDDEGLRLDGQCVNQEGTPVASLIVTRPARAE